jgi:superfamily II DNA/RNA helicase
VDPSLKKVQALVIIPRKILIDEYIDTFSKYDSESRFCLSKLIGGEPFNKKEIAKSQVLICSPGKLVGLIQGKTIDLSHVKIVVLDVCNGLFYKDIKGQTERILRSLKKSLTFWYLSPVVDEVSKESFLEMKPDGKTIDICDTRALHQIKYFKFYYVNEENIFGYIRSRCLDYDGQIVIFGCDLEELDRIKEFLAEFSPLMMTDALDLSQQLSTREEFRENRSKVMISHGSFHLARKIIVKSTVEIFNLDMQEPSILLARARRGVFCEGDKMICFFREFEEEEIEKLENGSQVKFETLIPKS